MMTKKIFYYLVFVVSVASFDVALACCHSISEGRLVNA